MIIKRVSALMLATMLVLLLVSCTEQPDTTVSSMVDYSTENTSSQTESEIKSNITLYINEYMKEKNTSVVDGDGDYSAWVEIYNPNETEQTLSGLYLSDTTEELRKFAFDSTMSVPANGYLLVFLSGKSKYTEYNELHAGFKLTAHSKELIISDKDGRIVDRTNLMPLVQNVSAGRGALGEIEYYSVPTPGKANIGGVDSIDACVTTYKDNVYISEVMSLNNSTHKNKTGDYTDWIELYNPKDSAVDLSGWFISDDADKPTKYTVPDGVTVGAGEYVLFYAAGNEIVTKKGEYYMPFSLSASGETLVLTTSARVTTDVFSYGTQRDGISTGRSDDHSKRILLYTSPTPGTANGDDGYAGYCIAPTFSRDGGCVSENSVTFTLSAESDATIYYTLDGTEPDESDEPYLSPISINANCVVRAKAYANGKLESNCASRTFIFGENHDIPVTCVSSDPDGLFSEKRGIYATGSGASSEFPYKGANYWKDWERPIGFEFYEDDGTLGAACNAGIKIFGQYSRAEAQKSFKLVFRAEYGTKELTYPFFRDYDVSTFKTLILRTSGQDWNSLKLRDAFFMQVVKGQMDVDYMEYRFCALYINGQYWGLYCIREHTNKDYIEAHRGIDGDNIDLIKGNKSVKEGSYDAHKALLDYIKSHDLSVQENFDYVASQIDLDNWMGWWITETFFSNTDTGNIKFYRERSDEGKWRWILFDLDWGMWPSTYERNRIDRMLDSKGHGTSSMFSTVIARGLMQNEDFKNKFIETYAYQLNHTFTEERMFAILDSMADEIRTEIPKNYDRWKALKPTSWEKNLIRMKEMLGERIELSKTHLKKTFKLSDKRMKELFPEDE